MEFNLVEGFDDRKDYEDYVDKLIDITNSINITKKTLLTGRNAGGKSFIRKMLTSIIHNKYKLEGKKALVLQASQELRTKSNPELGAMSSFAHDLEWLATSSNTLNCLQQVINKKDKASYIIIDEPEIGLGEELLMGVCDWLNNELGSVDCGVLITSHSRTFIDYCTVCDEWVNLEGLTKFEWLCRVPKQLDVEEFKEFSLGLFRCIRDRLNNKSK
jgi:energy-coupling factor transporter ATP-binding protein EcfA2